MRGGAFLKGKEGRVDFRKNTFFNGKEGRDDFRKPSLWQRETEGFEKNNYFIKNNLLFPLRIPRNPRYPRNAPTLLCITSSVSQSPLQKAN